MNTLKRAEITSGKPWTILQSFLKQFIERTLGMQCSNYKED